MSDDKGSVDEVSKDQPERGISTFSQITQFARNTIGLAVKMTDLQTSYCQTIWVKITSTSETLSEYFES